ncbi:RNA recognition motif, partial [Trifolium medium]|nr:RNA recognition motif [Trifolium medium]
REKVERETVGREGFGNRERSREQGYNRHQDNNTTSFFFQNFPEDVTESDLWKLLRKFGRIWDVYIPPKLVKRGCRFGFVKFLEVHSAKDLLRRLDKVWWGTYKLRFNMPRFDRDASKEVEVKDHKSHRVAGGRTGRVVEKGRSFREVLEEEKVEVRGDDFESKVQQEVASLEVFSHLHEGKEVWKVEPDSSQLKLLHSTLAF